MSTKKTRDLTLEDPVKAWWTPFVVMGTVLYCFKQRSNPQANPSVVSRNQNKVWKNNRRFYHFARIGLGKQFQPCWKYKFHTSYYIILHHFTSYYIILHHITSYYITLHHITSHYITLHHITSYYIILHHITSYYIILHHITSYYITLHHITSYYIINQIKHWTHTVLKTFQRPNFCALWMMGMILLTAHCSQSESFYEYV